MADTTVSELTPIVNENKDIRFLSVNGAPAVLSIEVARHFQRRHNHILRDIDKIRSICPKTFNASNFGRVEYTDAKGENRPAFLLSRDAFSLLVMGMTGRAAILWKLRYIEAFNALEAAVREDHASLAREAGYQQGLDEGQSFPVVEAQRKAAYLAGLQEADRIWRRNNSPRALRRMVELRRMGCTWREIGKTVGLSPEAARKRVARACQRGGVL